MKKLLIVLCTLALATTPGIYPAGKKGKGVAVSFITMRTIQAFLNLDLQAATQHEYQQKYLAAQKAVATLPERIKAQFEVKIADKHQAGRIQPTVAAVSKPRHKLPVAQVPRAVPAAQPLAPHQKAAADEGGLSNREMVGAATAIALILGYEFLVAPKLKTKQLGIATFCNALLNGENPLTAKPAQPAPDGTATVADGTKQNEPGFLKKFGFDIFLSLLGL